MAASYNFVDNQRAEAALMLNFPSHVVDGHNRKERERAEDSLAFKCRHQPENAFEQQVIQKHVEGMKPEGSHAGDGVDCNEIAAVLDEHLL